jgi:tetratricopeptide (TPR) repeat protein
MSKQTAHNLFIVSPLTSKQAGFYQELLGGLSSYERLGNRLIQQAEHAHAFRRFDRLKEIGEILANFPIKPYQAIGHYYLGIFYNRCGNGDLEQAKRLLTFAADTAPPRFRAKAILSLAAVSAHLKKPDAALYYFTETLKSSKDISTSLIAYQGIVVHKSREGYHKQALTDLESILPVIKYAPAHTYFDILNSYAVELGEVGRKEEARNIMRHVLASPLATAYPMWRETAEDLRPPRRSMVTVGVVPYNVLAMPERELGEPPSRQPKPARVLDLAKWKNKMVKEKNDEPDENIDAMDRKDLLVKLLELTTKEDIDEAKLRKIVKFAEATMTREKPPDKPAS